MYADATTQFAAGWQGNSDRRLRFSLLVSTAIVLAALTVARLPTPGLSMPAAELIVRLLRESPPPVEPLSLEPEAEAVADPVVETDITEAAKPEAVSSESVQRAWFDWEQAIQDAVRNTPRATEKTVSVNPGLDRRRRIAAEKFAPIPDHTPKPVWENVERDLTGRTVLRDGDCYKVIDDPNVGSREAFEVFGQYVAVCAWVKRKPQPLPWVAEINARRESPSRYARQPVE